MIDIAYFLLGTLLGALIVFLVMRGKGATATALLQYERQGRDDDKARAAEQAERLKQELLSQMASVKAEGAERLDAQRQGYEQRIEAMNADFARQKQEAKHEAEEQRSKELSALRQSYEEQLSLFKEQVTTVTEKMLKERSSELQQANTQRMDELFKPMRDNIMRMEASINANRVAAAEGQTRFEDAFKQMMESNARLGSQADRLSTALQRKNKVSGNWGELILSELLESQGLKPGIHFEEQNIMRDDAGAAMRNEESGSHMIPDVVMHLGDDRDVIIDSKMSVAAFVDYQNATTEEERGDAILRHIESIRAHVKELSAKDYSSYVRKSKRSIDFVIMFVPIEGALQLALSNNPSLWRDAFEKKVFIAGESTLIAALHIIKMTWMNIQQERNTQKIMDEAKKLIDRVSGFYSEFVTVGNKLNDAMKAYDVVTKRVSTGKQSIMSLGYRLEELGVKGKKTLPHPLEINDEDDEE